MSRTLNLIKNENLLLDSQIKEELVCDNDHPQGTSENPTATETRTPRYVEGFTQTKITRFNMSLKKKDKMRGKKRPKYLKAKGFVFEQSEPSQIGSEDVLVNGPFGRNQSSFSQKPNTEEKRNSDKSINEAESQSKAHVHLHSDHPQEKHGNNAATEVLTTIFVEKSIQAMGKTHPPKKVKKGNKKTQEKGNKKTQEKGNKKTQENGNKKTQVLTKPLKAQGFVSETTGSSDIGCKVNQTSSTEEPNRGQKRKAEESPDDVESQSRTPIQSSLQYNDRYEHFGNFIAAMLRDCQDQKSACNVMHEMFDLLHKALNK